MEEDFLSALAAYIPQDAREAEEKDVILSYAQQHRIRELPRIA